MTGKPLATLDNREGPLTTRPDVGVSGVWSRGLRGRRLPMEID